MLNWILRYITVITAVILIIWPVGIAIGKITEPFRKELYANLVQSAQYPKTDSLNKAGTYIGVFERLLVLSFTIAIIIGLVTKYIISN